jgi:rubrerythrin
LGESRGIYNLVGGIMGWDGAILEDQPRIAVFADHTLPAMIQTAMNLEKGALRFYTGAWQRYKDQPWTKILELLAQAETGHARILFRFHPKAKADEISFDELFDGLSGEILEGGMRLTDALASLPPPQGRACLATIELALKIENSAYDLYRVMANATHAAEAADAFITLAQAEKAHMQYLIEAIGKCKS